jgi:hypothetical protein
MKLRLERIELFIIVMIFLMLTVFISIGYSTTQLTFILDPDNPSFIYEENKFNDSNTYKNFVFSSNENKTAWISIPKNSTITFSNITLRGESTPTQAFATDYVYSIAVGNAITSTYDNEITVGTLTGIDLLNSTGNNIWINNFGKEVDGVDIGNVTNDEGNEIAAACKDKHVYLLRASDGSQIWNYTGTNYYNDVAIGNVVTSTSENEIVAGDSDKNVTLLNNQDQVIWNFNNNDGSINCVAIGDVDTSVEGNEVVAGDSQRHLYLINSTGQLIRGHEFGGTPGANILAVAVGDVNLSISGDEIAAAADDNKLYLLDNQLNILWSYKVDNSVESVAIGNVTADPGNEIVIGSSDPDNKVYLLNSTGQLILKYGTSKSVRGVAIGNVTADPGNEVIAGSLDGHVYILNFEYYPTNVYLDIGADGDKDWQHSSSKLREFVNVSGSVINSEIQNYLNNVCTSKVCNVPLVFHSDSGGAMNVTAINITYDYTASESISSSGPISVWSKTNNTEVNESVGNQAKNISYAYPANNIEIRYVKINNAASACDFAGKKYTTGTIDSQNLCNLSTEVFNINKTGVLPSPSLLWDSRMSTGMPIWGRDELPITTSDGKWIKNFTVWNETSTMPAIFYNVTANISIGSEVRSNQGLFVEWNDSIYDITPSKNCPNYENKTISGDKFYVCKQDSDGDGAVNFFKVKQPHTSTTNYTVNGSINSPPVLSNFRITPNSDIWGNNFSFYVNVTDYEGDNVTVNLWVYHVNSNVWEKVASKNTTSNTSKSETLTFNVTSTRSWVGQNYYLYEFQDFNGIEYMHPLQNTSINTTGPNVLKHNISILLIEGNNTSVIRIGSNSVTFTVVITDTNWNQNVSDDVNCSFWITKNRVNFILSNSTKTNSSGFCTFIFDPDSSYLAGQQWWKAGVYKDAYYNDNNSTNYTVYIFGELNINLTNSVINQNFTRGQDSILTAKLVDENINDVAEPGYTCTWYINNIQVNVTTTNNTGQCYHIWKTNCSSNLGSYPINVTLNGVSSYYTIANNKSSTNVNLKGTLNVTILLPKDNSILYERQNATLNSTAKDECGNESVYSNNVTWYTPQTVTAGPNYCPLSSTEIAYGFNTTWKLSDTCTPRHPQIIIANATGELYNSNKKNVSIYIFGFASVGVTFPSEGNDIWRNASYGLGNGLVKIVCKVISNASSFPVYGYPVNFWDDGNPLNDANSHTNVDDTNTTGHAEIIWNISSNITVPDGNHTIKCNITDYINPTYSLYFNTSVYQDNITVAVKGPVDWLPPRFLRVSANSVEQYKENVTIEADVYDVWGVDKVWVVINHADGTNSTHEMIKNSSSTWKYSENLTNLGNYDFTIFANDTTGNENHTSSWFEVYLPIILTGNITNWNGATNITANLNFYRNGTNYIIHQINTNSSFGYYNLTIHKRLYDLEVKVFNYTILFYNINTTETAIKQFNTTKPTNITNPLNFTVIDVTWTRPARYITRLAAFDINSIFVNDFTTITMNYSSTAGDIQYEPSVRISRCPSWSYVYTNCTTNWDDPAGIPDLEYDTVSLNVTSLSVYAAIEAAQCGDHWCHAGERCGEIYYCPDDCGKCPSGETGGPSGGGSSGGGGTPITTTFPLSLWLFSVRTNLTEPQLNPGTEETYALWVTNNVDRKINTSISITGSIAKFISLEKKSMEIDPKAEDIDKIYVVVPSDAEPGTYTGHINVVGDGKTEALPVTLTVSIKGATYLDVLVESRNKRVGINETARFRVMLYNYGLWKKLNLNLTYFIKNPETQEVFYEENEGLEITQSKTLDKMVPLSGLNVSVGRYLFNVTVQYDSKVASAYDDFEVTESFWTTDRINMMIYIILGVSTPIIIYFVRKRYISWKLSKARYIFPIDFRKLPVGKIWLGKIAETTRKAYFDMNELRTHVLTAGATGSGKSVSAMIFVEELLKENIPIIVFDPTAQWSGFVRPCKDPNLIRYYKEFGLSTRDTRPYNGMIYEVTDPNVKIDFDKFMNPGEITVFMLNKLKPGQYDDAVINIIDTIFAHGWEESTKLRMVVVFDEVHRLLEKYGGKGGYVSLEKACREFRKWGIGLIMASQVLSDFKEAIKGNVLTEIQLHTKSLGDLGRVEKKYGLDYVKRVTRLEVGVGMMQNPRYNEGRPWFVAFRPTLHEPHKIPDVDLQTYKEYAAILAKIEAKIESMEKAGQDVFDLKTEFKLAQDKLKKGRFRMAKIYIDSLRKHVLEG